MIGPALSRRTTLAWVAAAAASPLAGCGRGDWPNAAGAPVTAQGYGMDPDLTDPKTPWPLTLNEAQRAVLRICADLILPADETSPSAGALGVDGFIDEWVSAPYERQRADRDLILNGLVWLDRESRKRFEADFTALDDTQRRAIFDDIAFSDRIAPERERAGAFFARLRGLVMAGYYTLPEGLADIGYIGNTPIEGDYPGPSREALDHLRAQLAALNLTMPD